MTINVLNDHVIINNFHAAVIKSSNTTLQLFTKTQAKTACSLYNQREVLVTNYFSYSIVKKTKMQKKNIQFAVTNLYNINNFDNNKNLYGL